MSCNRCAATAEAVAPAVGAGGIEANWSGHRDHPKNCRDCGAFLRADGGCTACERGLSYSVRSDGQSIRMESVASRAANALGYDPTSRQLVVEYKHGRLYSYSDVPPESYEAVRTSSSIGRSLKAIRDNHSFVYLGRAGDVSAPASPGDETPAMGSSSSPRVRLSCGHTMETAVSPGDEEWCTQCDDFATVEAPPVKTPDVSGATEPPDASESAELNPPLPKTEYGRAAFNAQHNRADNPGAQAKVKDIGYSRVSMALRGVGVAHKPPSDHIRNMVWQYLDRCTCGAWISPRSPVCNNPRCGFKGSTVGKTRPWPPGDVVWVNRKQDVGYEVGMAVPNPPAPKKKKVKRSAATPATTGKPPTGAEAFADYEERMVAYAKTRYGLEKNDFIDSVDLAEQVESGETPEELVERIARKYDLTPITDGEGEGDEPEPASDSFYTPLSNPTIDQVVDAWRKLQEKHEAEYEGRRPEKYRITFKEPVQVRKNSRQIITTDSITVDLFSTSKNQFCYTFYSRKGYDLRTIRNDFGSPAVDKITGIEAVTLEEKLRENKVKVQQLANSIHPNAWPVLREQMKAEPENHAFYGLNRVSMRQVFGDSVVKALERAFEEGRDYSYSLPGVRRDRRVEVRRQPDGTVKAWYQSEHAGYGNGDYYILLNPYTASFKETD